MGRYHLRALLFALKPNQLSPSTGWVSTTIQSWTHHNFQLFASICLDFDWQATTFTYTHMRYVVVIVCGCVVDKNSQKKRHLKQQQQKITNNYDKLLLNIWLRLFGLWHLIGIYINFLSSFRFHRVCVYKHISVLCLFLSVWSHLYGW